MAGLHADGLGKRIRHRAMGEGAEKPALAVHVKIARGPDRRRAHVAGKHRIVRRQLIKYFRYVLWMNRCAPRLADREIIETLAGILIMTKTNVEIRSIVLALKQRSQ